jgi:hypothetical protein
MITIAVYHNSIDAHIAKGLLESEGIQCQIMNEMASQTLAIGNIELMVQESDAERAQAILNQSDV